MNRDAQFHAQAEAELLRQCAATGQIGADQLYQHARAGEYSTSNAFVAAVCDQAGQQVALVPAQQTLADMQREIADDAARVLIETRALQVGLVRGPEGDTLLYDTSQLDPHEAGPDELQADLLADVSRAARYLRLRGIAVQPAGCGNLVTFRRV